MAAAQEAAARAVVGMAAVAWAEAEMAVVAVVAASTGEVGVLEASQRAKQEGTMVVVAMGAEAAE